MHIFYTRLIALVYTHLIASIPFVILRYIETLHYMSCDALRNFIMGPAIPWDTSIYGMRRLEIFEYISCDAPWVLTGTFDLIDLYIGPVIAMIPPHTWPANCFHVLHCIASLIEFIFTCFFQCFTNLWLQVAETFSNYILVQFFLPSQLKLLGAFRFTHTYFASSLQIEHSDHTR